MYKMGLCGVRCAGKAVCRLFRSQHKPFLCTGSALLFFTVCKACVFQTRPPGFFARLCAILIERQKGGGGMAVSQYEFTGKRPLRLKEMPTDGRADGVRKADKPAVLAKTQENLAKIARWQD